MRARGFLQLRGVNGSLGMLEQARARGLYQRLSLCTLGQEPLPGPEVGAPSDGQVPCNAIPELLCVTKPGGLVCLTTRTNLSNLQNKEALEATPGRLEQAGAWDCLPPSWRWYPASLPRMASSSALSTCTESRRRPRLRK
uniref:Uncharacterized protein n=1 Tax=Rhinopithecus bieti TaxID=61621 RepID=A0A2K6L1Q2_RHIBE